MIFSHLYHNPMLDLLFTCMPIGATIFCNLYVIIFVISESHFVNSDNSVILLTHTISLIVSDSYEHC